MSDRTIGRRTVLKTGVAALAAARILVENPEAVYGFPKLG
jgi:hypothetical protein